MASKPNFWPSTPEELAKLRREQQAIKDYHTGLETAEIDRKNNIASGMSKEKANAIWRKEIAALGEDCDSIIDELREITR